MKDSRQMLKEKLDAIDREQPIYTPLSGTELIIIVIAVLIIIMITPSILPFIV